MSESCQAIVADFAWWSQRCGEPSVTTVSVDGEDFAACAEHSQVRTYAEDA